jgi:hypothetical protein
MFKRMTIVIMNVKRNQFIAWKKSDKEKVTIGDKYSLQRYLPTFNSKAKERRSPEGVYTCLDAGIRQCIHGLQ